MSKIINDEAKPIYKRSLLALRSHLSSKNNLEMVIFLLQRDIDVNTLYYKNQTALFWLFA